MPPTLSCQLDVSNIEHCLTFKKLFFHILSFIEKMVAKAAFKARFHGRFGANCARIAARFQSQDKLLPSKTCCTTIGKNGIFLILRYVFKTTSLSYKDFTV